MEVFLVFFFLLSLLVDYEFLIECGKETSREPAPVLETFV